MDTTKKNVNAKKNNIKKRKKIVVQEVIAEPKKKTNSKKNTDKNTLVDHQKYNKVTTNKSKSSKNNVKVKKVIKIDDFVDNKENYIEKNIIKEDQKNDGVLLNEFDNTSKIPIKKTKKTDSKQDSLLNNKTLKVKNNLNNDEINVTPKKILTQKEINRKKYEKSQQKYRVNNKVKEAKQEIKDENIILETQQEEKEIIKEKKKNKFIEFLKNIYRKYQNNLNNENNFYLQTEKKGKRFKRYVMEASIYAIIITILNIVSTFIFKNIDTINLFDIKVLNIVLTMFVILIISFLVTLFFDFLITEIWIKLKKRKINKMKESE